MNIADSNQLIEMRFLQIDKIDNVLIYLQENYLNIENFFL